MAGKRRKNSWRALVRNAPRGKGRKYRMRPFPPFSANFPVLKGATKRGIGSVTTTHG